MDNKPIVTFNFKVPNEAEVGDIYEVKFNDIRSFSGLDCDFEYFELENSEIEVLEETKSILIIWYLKRKMKTAM